MSGAAATLVWAREQGPQTWRGVLVEYVAGGWVVDGVRWPSMRSAWRALVQVPERRTT